MATNKFAGVACQGLNKQKWTKKRQRKNNIIGLAEESEA